MVELTADGFDDIEVQKCETTDLSTAYNACVSDIFRNEYLSPRPNVTTLQLPKQGIGNWCHPQTLAEIDDSGLRHRLETENGVISTEIGIPFKMPSKGNNIIYTSLWDNYPDRSSIKLNGQATHIYVVLAGSTNHMQANIANANLKIRYKDGSESVTPIVSPHNFAPIEQDFYYDNYAYALADGMQPPYRMHLATGRVSRNLGKDLDITGVDGRRIPGGATVLLDIPTDPAKQLESIELETLSGDVVIGLMGLTIQRP